MSRGRSISVAPSVPTVSLKFVSVTETYFAVSIPRDAKISFTPEIPLRRKASATVVFSPFICAVMSGAIAFIFRLFSLTDADRTEQNDSSDEL